MLNIHFYKVDPFFFLTNIISFKTENEVIHVCVIILVYYDECCVCVDACLSLC
jgi:hypothetical protein